MPSLFWIVLISLLAADLLWWWRADRRARRLRHALGWRLLLGLFTGGQIAARLKEYKPPPRNYPRGYYKLFAEHTRQAHEGCDFDFLEGAEGIPEPEIH